MTTERVPEPLPVFQPATLPPAVEVFASGLDADRHRGRRIVRDLVLRMRPDVGAFSVLGSVRVGGGAFWGLTASNGLTIAARAIDLADEDAARADALSLVGRLWQLDIVPVFDAARGRASFWVVGGNEILLVAGQASHHPSGSAERALRRALNAAGGRW